VPTASRLLIATALVALRWPPAVAAQREVGLLYGSWEVGRTVTYEARLDQPWGSMLRHGIALQIASERGGAARAFYGVGYELQVLRGRRVLGPYAVLSAALGGATDTAGQALAALWSAGAGLEWRPVRFFAIDVERALSGQRPGPRGFWRQAPQSGGYYAGHHGRSRRHRPACLRNARGVPGGRRPGRSVPTAHAGRPYGDVVERRWT
jgi:hypothetical protein